MKSQTQRLHQQLPDECPDNFCLAPFISTRQNEQGMTSPCAFGAGEWNLDKFTKEERWNHSSVNDLRAKFIRGERPRECYRCHAEEDAGKQSLRQRQFKYFPDAYENFVKTGDWLNGPITGVFKTSNVCNLACRSCGGWDTSLYKDEGEYYRDNYKTTDEAYPELGLHNRFIPPRNPNHMEFASFADIGDNFKKLDFFGGEPLVNTTHLDLLEHIIESGKSEECTLYYSTNVVQFPHKRLLDAWQKFKRVELSLSIDGLGEKFEYTRWPAKWSKVERNVERFMELHQRFPDVEWDIQGTTCYSAMTLFSFRDTYTWLQENMDATYVNMVNFPNYLAPHIVPESVKTSLMFYYMGQYDDTVNYVNLHPHDPKSFKQFCIWMKRQDLYRKQDFTTTFPELYEQIKPWWDEYTKDLSNKNYHSDKVLDYD